MPGERDVRDLLGHADPSFQPAALGHREVARNALDLRIVQAVGRQLVVRGEPFEDRRALEDEVGLIGGESRGRQGDRTVAVRERPGSVRRLLRAERIVLRAKERRHGARGDLEIAWSKLPIRLAAIGRRV